MEIPLLNIVKTAAELKSIQPSPDMNVLMVGSQSLGDGLGGFYRWDPTSSATEDSTYMNVVTSDMTTSGRWVRIFQKAKSVTGGGILVSNGGIKTFFVSGSTDSNGKITLNLTDDNTATGNALFKEIWSITANPNTNANGPATAVQSYRENLAANLKTATFGFYKANAVTVTLGLLLTPVASIGSGTVVQFRVEGV